MTSKFTDIELEYVKTQRLGRLATINKHGEPQIAPVTYLYNAELDTIDIGGGALLSGNHERTVLTPLGSVRTDPSTHPLTTRQNQLYLI